MLLLAIDTATSAITVALFEDDVLAEESIVDARRHTEELAPAIARALASAHREIGEVTDIAVGTGPGPFTGLRVGLVTAMTMAHALGIPVHGVCSLDALAQTYLDAGGTGEFVVATDARRKEVYWARYAAAASGELVAQTEPAVDRPGELPPSVTALPVVGRGGRMYAQWLPHAVGPLDVSAASLARLAAGRVARGLAMPITPRYLRRPDALAPGVPKSTLLPAPGVRR